MLLAAAASFLAASTSWALTTPLLVNFQGKLLSASNNAPQNGNIAFQFRILDAASGGNVLWGPENQTITVTNGVFNAQLGSVVAMTTDVFSGGSAYLSVVASPDTYPTGEMLPRQQLVASPYAVTAQQVASANGIRINPGVSYSTFTMGGNLLLQSGISAATGTFSAAGNTQYSLVASSGIQINAGTLDVNGPGGLDASATGLKASTGTFTASGNTQYSLYTASGIFILNGTLNAGGGGIDATGAGVVASTGVFQATGNGQYSLFTSSGIQVGQGAQVGVYANFFNGTSVKAGTATFTATGSQQFSMYLSSGMFLSSGTLKVSGTGAGIDASGYNVIAASFTGSGVWLTGVRPQVSDSSSTTGAALASNTETIAVSTNIALADNRGSILLLGDVDVVTNGTAGTCFTRIRVNLAGACGTTSTPIIFAETFKVPATTSGTHTLAMPVFSQFSPASTNNGSYCLTVQCTTTYTRTNTHLSIIAGAP